MSVWVASRAAGLGALWLLAASAALGYAARMAGPVRLRWVRPLHYLHSALAAAGWLGALMHALLLRYDDYMPFAWKDLFVPFSSSYRPVWTGLGILSLYGWGLTLLTFDGRRSLGAHTFKLVHGAAPAVLLMAGLHALGAGSDGHLASLRWGALLAALMGLLGVMAAVMARLQRIGPQVAAAWRRPTSELAAWRGRQALPTRALPTPALPVQAGPTEGAHEAHADPRGGR